jgi:hypothetical protein
MAKTSYTYQNTRAVIQDTGLNSTFQNVEDNLDGTTGKLDSINIRSEGLNRKHFQLTTPPNELDQVADRQIYTLDNSAAGVYETILTYGTSISLEVGECLRVEGTCLSRDLTVNGGTPAQRGASQYYFQWFMDFGAGDVAVGPPFGYGTISAGRPDEGTQDDTNGWFKRHLLSYVHIPTTNQTVSNVKLKAKWDTNAAAANSIQFYERNIIVVHGRW